MILSSATIFWFRKKTASLDDKEIYKMKLFPIMPIIFMLAYLFVAVSIAINNPDSAMIAMAVLAGFICIYYVLTYFNRNKKTA
jgi:basic amino acid/polyamine antiporter, APA family